MLWVILFFGNMPNPALTSTAWMMRILMSSYTTDCKKCIKWGLCYHWVAISVLKKARCEVFAKNELPKYRKEGYTHRKNIYTGKFERVMV